MAVGDSHLPGTVIAANRGKGQHHMAGVKTESVSSRRRFIGAAGLSGAAMALHACNRPSITPAPQHTDETVKPGPQPSRLIPYPAETPLNPGPTLANIWLNQGILRQDIRRGFAGFAGNAEGVPMTLSLTLRNIKKDFAAAQHYAVYVWHADAAGEYSVFNMSTTNYLRGVGVTDRDGRVRFSTVFPGTYRGRLPHIHFEVYPSLHSASDVRHRLLSSRILFPDIVSQSVYGSHSAYADSVARYSELTFQRPDDLYENTQSALRVARVSGSAVSDLTASLTICV